MSIYFIYMFLYMDICEYFLIYVRCYVQIWKMLKQFFKKEKNLYHSMIPGFWFLNLYFQNYLD